MTRAEGGWLDRLLDAANARGVAVYLQVMAASPPGYRVQFSNALADDACLGPDGQPHGQRVDRNASLASSHVVAYITTLLTELASRYPGVAGFRLDWPEYPPYDFRSALFDFNPAALAQVAQAGHDPAALAREVTAWAQQLTRAAAASASHGSRVTRDALLAAGWGSLTGTDGAACGHSSMPSAPPHCRYCVRAAQRWTPCPERDGASSRRFFRRRCIAFPAFRSMRSTALPMPSA